MLYLNIKEGKGVRIETSSGEVIWVNISETRAHSVRIGFSAAPEILIEKQETWEERRKQATSSTQAD